MLFIYVITTQVDEVFEEFSCFAERLAEKLIVELTAEKSFGIEV